MAHTSDGFKMVTGTWILVLVLDTYLVWCGCGEGKDDEGWSNIDVVCVDSCGEVTDEGKDDGIDNTDDADGDTISEDDPDLE